jgi:hypothetical protein
VIADKRRIRRLYGHVSSRELAGIDQGLELFLGLGREHVEAPTT